MQPNMQLFDEAASELAADILLVNAGMLPPVDENVRQIVSARPAGHRKVILVLVTPGGLPDVAYRIAMVLHDKYEHVTICVPGGVKAQAPCSPLRVRTS